MESAKDLQFDRTILPQTSELAKVRDEVAQFLKQAKLSKGLGSRLVLAVDEALSAIMSYNDAKGYSHEMQLSVDLNDVRFKATLTDPMTDFGLDRTYDQIHRDRKYKISFYLMTRIMDEVSYNFKRGFENHLVLLKFL